MSATTDANPTDAGPPDPGEGALPDKLVKLVQVRGLTKDYFTGGKRLRVLRGVDLDIYRNEFLSIQGPSGAGKSTLLHIIGLLDRPTSGTLLVRSSGDEDTPLENPFLHSAKRQAVFRNRTMGFVFQFYHLFPDLTAVENVILPPMVGMGFFEYRRKKEAFRDRAHQLLDAVGLTERSHHKPNQLSGGERQRVAIARALMLEPPLLLCDEPTGNLDYRTGRKILDLLFDLKEQTRTTFVVVTHDAQLAARADRHLVLSEGVMVPHTAPGAADPPVLE